MFYLVKTPWWLKRFYPSFTWHINTRENDLFLTFDDGPHSEATPFVLEQLKTYNAKATFFCIGKNVVAHPDIYQRILDEGHSIGNHTYNHLNGWKSGDEEYLRDIADASKFIDSNLFRPPYGKITSFKAKHVRVAMKQSDTNIVMWDVLSGDFDAGVNAEDCLQNVILNSTRGSIIVFHDNARSFEKLKIVLPRVLKYFGEKGFAFQPIKWQKREIKPVELTV